MKCMKFKRFAKSVKLVELVNKTENQNVDL